MQALPSMPAIATALASAAPRIAPWDLEVSSRVLCLILQPLPCEGKAKRKPRHPRAVAEAFLRFSPRVQLREPHILFLDITSTAHFFRPRDLDSGETAEGNLVSAALNLARELGFSARTAISDTAAGAQAFAQLDRNFICPPGEEREKLQPLSLPLLLHLEGLVPWQRPRDIEQVVTFFFMLGFEKVGDLERFGLTSFQDRWGETGALLWKRLHALDRTPISPLLPTEPLTEYLHFEFPVSLLSLLLHQAKNSLQFLFARLQGRCLFARKILLRLHCEYSGKKHVIEIEPSTPSRDLSLFLTLLENKLDQIDLDNPILEYEIEAIPCPERVHQLDFFEPRNRDQDKLENLFSLLQQSDVRIGRYGIRRSIMPEQSWFVRAHSDVDYQDAGFENSGAVALAVRTSQATLLEKEMAYSHLPEYGADVMQAPRPTRILRNPRRLPIHEMQKLRLLTGHPIERLEELWAETEGRRDYYFAVSPQGQCLWIYKDLDEQEYYLHGYFD